MLHDVAAMAALIARASLGAMLIIAAVAKEANRKSFTHTLITLGLPEGYLVQLTTLLVPVLEACLGIVVIVGIWPQAADLGLLLLMLVFTGIIALGVQHAPNTMCQCFGALSVSRFGRVLLIRSVGLTLVALFVLVVDNPIRDSGAPIWAIGFLATGYFLLAVVAAHAVRFVAEIKERLAA